MHPNALYVAGMTSRKAKHVRSQPTPFVAVEDFEEHGQQGSAEVADLMSWEQAAACALTTCFLFSKSCDVKPCEINVTSM
jgi:hypothetical protein